VSTQQYFESLGCDPVYASDPIPPITTESIFGHASPSPPADIGDSMNLDSTIFPLVEPSPPSPTTTSDFHFPLYHQPIPDNDFVPGVNPDACPGSPEPYDEDFERSALKEELRALEDIEYGWPSILRSHVLRCSLSLIGGNLAEYDISICKAFACVRATLAPYPTDSVLH